MAVKRRFILNNHKLIADEVEEIFNNSKEGIGNLGKNVKMMTMIF